MKVSELKVLVDELVNGGYGDDVVTVYPADADGPINFEQGASWTVTGADTLADPDDFVTFLIDTEDQ